MGGAVVEVAKLILERIAIALAGLRRASHRSSPYLLHPHDASPHGIVGVSTRFDLCFVALGDPVHSFSRAEAGRAHCIPASPAPTDREARTRRREGASRGPSRFPIPARRDPESRNRS